jgi:type I restriction enzyme S subunit
VEQLAIRQGDFFVSRGNGSLHLVGRGTLAQQPPEFIIFPDTMIRLRLTRVEPLVKFLSLIWASRPLREQIERKARTSAGIYKISQRDIESFLIPLPPTAEQVEIVKEIERRLSIVDEIESQVDTNLKRAARLRQGILKQAFEGRLVPQDPNDEPAEKLLERIRQDGHLTPASNGGDSRERRRSVGKSKAPYPLPPANLGKRG